MKRNANIDGLLQSLLGSEKTTALFDTLNMPAALSHCEPGVVSRTELAQAMNMALFDGLIARSANGRRYTARALAAVRERRRAPGAAEHARDDMSSVSAAAREPSAVCFDHGALRTVRWAQNGALPPGEAAFARILIPLGFEMRNRYPLDKLGMTGRAYAHRDAPEDIAQFFVSELHPERFSPAFQEAVTQIVSTSVDPLTPNAVALLWDLHRDGSLPLAYAQELLPVIVGAFARQHAVPRERDYEAVLKESAEMAWIATEGNAFNHATDRVTDVFALADAEKSLGLPMKPDVECSRSGRVFQTAYRADPVERPFIDRDGREITRTVPGSFYEFITRKHEFDKETGRWRLDLRFDAGNAQGIFKMTAGAVM
ncbi:DUF1338 domain-containing protein [Robbsia sp. KACC 23696]|uniref:DUF1338 domain-containing protein n=1 Tax=Robbsia sp. KACC 23696 TaxID=3149231 RepID=UPI00325BDECF